LGYFWDALRPFDQLAISFSTYIKPIVLIISITLFVIAVLAYNKNKSRRFLLIAVAFFFFSAEWLLKTLDIFVSPGSFFSIAAQDVFELVILGALFVALFWK